MTTATIKPTIVRAEDGSSHYWNGTDYDTRPPGDAFIRSILFVVEANVLAVVGAFLGALVATAFGYPADDPRASFLMFTCFIATPLIYFTVTVHFGATLAQRIAGYRTVCIHTNEAPSWGPSFLRALVLIFAMLPLVGFVYFFVCSAAQFNRAPHDMAAGTFVLGRAPIQPIAVQQANHRSETA